MGLSMCPHCGKCEISLLESGVVVFQNSNERGGVWFLLIDIRLRSSSSVIDRAQPSYAFNDTRRYRQVASSVIFLRLPFRR